MRLASVAAAFVAAASLTGCSLVGGGGDAAPELLQFKNDGRPDELATVSARPLEFPDLAIGLQPPTNDGFNRADRRPREEAILAMGGAPAGSGDPSDHPELIAYATRFGSAPMIRESLDAEDLDYRRKNDGLLLERMFRVNVYFDAYRPQALDSYAELRRFRRAGIRTPAAPPESGAR